MKPSIQRLAMETARNAGGITHGRKWAYDMRSSAVEDGNTLQFKLWHAVFQRLAECEQHLKDYRDRKAS